MSRVRVKISHKDDIRRITLSPNEIQYRSIQEIVAEIFQLDKKCFQIKYFDDDNDLITIGNDNDLKEAISVLSGQQRMRSLRMYVKVKGENYDIAQSMMESSLLSSSVMNNNYQPYNPTSPNPNTPSNRLPDLQYLPTMNQIPSNPNFIPTEVKQESPLHVNRSPVSFEEPKPKIQPVSFIPKPEEPKKVDPPKKKEPFRGREIIGREPNVDVVGGKQVITKEWVVKNNGNSIWPPGCTVRTTDNKYIENIEVAGPGNETVVKLSIKPSRLIYGEHRWDCILRAPNGQVICNLTPCRITLKEPEKPKPVLEPVQPKPEPVQPEPVIQPKQEPKDAIFEANLRQIIDMGFPEDKARNALQKGKTVDEALAVLFGE